MKTEEIRNAYIDFTNNLALIAESHDENSYMHIHRVSKLSAFLAQKYGLSDEEVEKIRIFFSFARCWKAVDFARHS